MSDSFIGTDHLHSDTASGRFGRFRELGRSLLGETVAGEEADFLFESECGVLDLGHSRCGEVVPLSGIWKRRRIKGKLRYYCEPYYIPLDKKSVKQLACREKMRKAMKAWGNLFLGCWDLGDNLIGDNQEWYNRHVVGKGRTGYNWFVKRHLLSN